MTSRIGSDGEGLQPSAAEDIIWVKLPTLGSYASNGSDINTGGKILKSKSQKSCFCLNNRRRPISDHVSLISARLKESMTATLAATLGRAVLRTAGFDVLAHSHQPHGSPQLIPQ